MTEERSRSTFRARHLQVDEDLVISKRMVKDLVHYSINATPIIMGEHAVFHYVCMIIAMYID